MTIGPLTLPMAPLILVVSVAIALLVARLAARQTRDAERIILNSVIVGLVVARLSFVAHYLPAYHGDMLKMLDFRDRGFDLVPGAVAGALMLVWTAVRRRHTRRALIVATVSGVLSWSVATAVASTSDEGRFLPDVRLVDMNGKQQVLARHDGKPLVVNLWASWCGPCRREMPMLAEAQRQYSGVDITFVNQGESRDTVGDFLTGEAISLQNLVLDPSLAVARAVGARAFPTTLFYDGNGKLLAVHLGPFSAATFQNALETLYPKAVAGQS